MSGLEIPGPPRNIVEKSEYDMCCKFDQTASNLLCLLRQKSTSFVSLELE